MLKNRERAFANETNYSVGELADKSVAIFHTGVGAKTSQQRLPKFLKRVRPTCLISAGFAGALTDDLHIGELFAGENFSDADLLATARQVLTSFQVHFGKLVTAPAMIDDTNSRAKLRAITGAAAVDMETECIAQECAQHGVPLLSLRAITDTPAAPFPAPAQVLFNLERQKTEAGKLALYLLKHPAAINRLLRFSRRIAAARETLTTAIDALVRNS